MDDRLSTEAIRAGLSTRYVGQIVHYFDAVGSTNTVAKSLAREGAPEGTLVIADRQTRGRGRLDRQWLAPAGTSLLLSLIFRPFLTPPQVARMTMICSLGVCSAIESVTGLRPFIKWPNDVVLNSRKAGGILTELGLSGGRLDFVVVGIGLNVNVRFEDAAEEHAPDTATDTSQASLRGLAARATSLWQELGEKVSRLKLLQAMLVDIERRYEALRAGHEPMVEWAGRLETLGRSVTVTSLDETWTGHVEGVDADGALLLRLADGTLERILVGDVTLRDRVPR